MWESGLGSGETFGDTLSDSQTQDPEQVKKLISFHVCSSSSTYRGIVHLPRPMRGWWRSVFGLILFDGR